jgi:hypothetical protein
MPRYRLVVACHEHPRSHMESPLVSEEVKLSTIDPVELRDHLGQFITQYQAHYGCPQAGGFLALQEDLPQLQMRAGVRWILWLEAELAPYAKTCTNCGWLTQKGVDFGRGLYCNNEACQREADRLMHEQREQALALRREQGQCQFDDLAYSSFCPNPAIRGSEFCQEHTGFLCFCGQQATHQCTADTFDMVCGNPICNEHSFCSPHLARAEFYKHMGLL